MYVLCYNCTVVNRSHLEKHGMDTKKKVLIKMHTKPFLLEDLAVCRFSCKGEFVTKCTAANSTGM